MARIRQEITLGAAPHFGPVLRFEKLRIEALQFRVARPDLLFQTVAMLPQGRIPLLDLAQHFVKSIHQLAQFVVHSFLRADCVILS